MYRLPIQPWALGPPAALLAMVGGCLDDFEPPPDEPGLLEPCCHDLGRCVTSALLTSEQTEDLSQDSCEPALLCVPDALRPDGDPLSTCESLLGAEGRCVPDCVPALAEQRDQLPTEGCPEHHLCAPCFDPLDGESTELCELGDDPGPSEPPRLFEDCCGEIGRCVPGTLVDDDQRESLDSELCGDELLCVPQEFLEDESTVLDTCSSLLGAEGRCVPACLPTVADQAADLPEGDCADGYLCAPCYDPLDGDETGVCDLGGDPGPSEAPTLFESCCQAHGRCVPADLVPTAARGSLEADSCPTGTGDELLCTPLGFIEDEDFTPEPCRATLDVEGRCLPSCLPALAEQADLLERDTCREGELCAPCFDPIDGASTDVCGFGDDEPAEPPAIFETCCGGVARCVPAEVVPEDQRADLESALCGDELICLPEVFLEDGPVVFATCDSLLGAEGRCLPSCLPSLQDQVDDLPTGGCPEQHVCAPCFDPLDGEATGACELGDDGGPLTSAVTFGSCCDGVGRCIPSDMVPEGDRDGLARDACKEGELCSPEAALTDDPYIPDSCSSLLGAEGRCLATCLPSIADQAGELPAGGCPEQHVCAPCFEPVDGLESGACAIGDDPGPTQSAVTFASCCDGGGRCVPEDLVDSEQRAALGRDACAEGALCSPEAFLRDDAHVPMSCSSVLGGEGRCLAECLPFIAAQPDLPTSGCPAAHRCAPCFEPVDGAATGACQLAGDPGPSEPRTVFPDCCVLDDVSRGACVPLALAPPEAAALPQESCANADDRCIPRELLRTPPRAPTSCVALGGTAPGVCTYACLVPPELQAITTSEGCTSVQRCVPCEIEGTPTGVCP
ncbi:MAG: hypothetical protein OXT09_12685 [Myxococcales bacterium]|nr:hypothetical protein [Myxococcales bacterium]